MFICCHVQRTDEKNPSKWYYADTKSFFSSLAKATLKLKFLIVKFRRKKKKRFLAGFFFFFASFPDRSFVSWAVLAHTATSFLPVLEFIITNYCTEAFRRVWCADQDERVVKLAFSHCLAFDISKIQVKYLCRSISYIRMHLWSQSFKSVAGAFLYSAFSAICLFLDLFSIS